MRFELPIRLIERTEGNPFFLEESVRTLVETRALVGEAGAYRLLQDYPSIQVPPTVQAVLAARIDRLPADEKRLLQMAAVIGTEVPFSLLQRIAEMSDATLHPCLTHLQAAEFLYETRLFPERVYTFKHALTHEVAYSSLLQERRRALHAQIVETLEILAGDRLADQVERLAYHAVRGEVWDKAVSYHRQAGTKARNHSAYREAVTSFEEALSALEHLPKQRDTMEQAVDLRLALRHALQPLREHDRIRDILYEAESIAEALGDSHRLGRILSYLINTSCLTDDLEQARVTGQRALDLMASHQDSGIQRMTYLQLAQVYFHSGYYCQAIDALKWNVDSFVEQPDSEISGLGLLTVMDRWWLVNSLAEVGRFAEGIAYAEEAVRMAGEADHPYTLSAAYLGIAFCYFRQGDLNQALIFSRRGFDLCQCWQIHNHLLWHTSVLSLSLALSGQGHEALVCLEQTLGANDIIWSQRGVGTGTILRSSELGETYLLAGRLDDASQCAMQALERSRAQDTRGYQAWALRLLGDIAMHGDPPDTDQAETHYQQALALADELGMCPLQAHCHRGLGTFYRQTGQPEQARAELTTAIDLYRDMEMTFWLPETETALTQVE